MQTQDNDRADAPGSKSRHPLRGSTDRRRPAASDDDALAAPAPPTDDTPTIISRHSPAGVTAQPPDPDGIRGRRLAHFELLEPIGVGGMAAVLRARDTQLDRLVALKILPPDMAGDEENVRRFHQEARSAAKLDHENVARVFFCGEDQRLHFIAFEFVEGDNLRTILERRGRLPVAEALNYVIQVAAGLAHASSRGVVHRDVKPSNIIITPSGRAKLVDMGLARTMERTGNAELTQSGVTLGTFDYISPEQALEPREADVRSDVYSLGCTFYHLLTGRTPTPEGTAAKKLHHHQHVNPVDPRHYVPSLPFEVVQILDRMMAKKPGDRFQTPEELVHRLLIAAKGLGMRAEAPEGMLSLETTLPGDGRGRPLLWAGLAAVAVVALVFLLDPLSTSTQKPDDPSEKRKPGGNESLVAVKDAPPPAKDAREKAPPVTAEEATPSENVYRSPDAPSAEHLLKWLADRRDAERIELRLHGELNLTPDQSAPLCLLVQAKKQVKILPRDTDSRHPPTIRLSHSAEGRVAALTIAAPQSHVEGVRFVVDATGVAVTMAALYLRPGKHEVRRCEFVQVMADLSAEDDGKRVASLVAEGSRGGRAEVRVSRCLFLGFARRDGDGDDRLSGADGGGRDAIARRGPVKLDVSDCVFGPHAAAFRLEGDGGDNSERSAVSVKQCTVLLSPNRCSAFEVPAAATGHLRLDVAHCLFSRLDLPAADADGAAVLLRQAAAGHPQTISYEGTENVYHDLDGYWVVADAWRKARAGWGAFRKNTSDVRNASRVVLAWPWLTPMNPPKGDSFVQLLDRRELDRALRLSPHLAALRKGDRPASFVGAETVLGERLPAADDKTKPDDGGKAPRILLVEAAEDDEVKLPDKDNGVYQHLHEAVENARPGDVILVRHDGKDGKMAVRPIHLAGRSASDLTIRPARRFRPLLALGESDTDGTLFRVQDGKLRLEGLDFHVTPNAASSKVVFKLVSLVALTGDGECDLSDCAVTLERTEATPAALAMLAARPDSDMAKSGMRPLRKPEEGPCLRLKDCFVRGEGDLLAAKTSKPCQLDVTNSVAALSGSLVSFAVAGSGEVGMNAKVAVNLSQATTYLGGPLVKLVVAKDSRDLSGVAPIQCKAGGCLFVAAKEKVSLVQLTGPQTDAVQAKFSWTKQDRNGYGGYVTLLSIVSTGDSEMQSTTQVNMNKWVMDYNGGEETPDRIKLAAPADAKFAQMQPGWFARPSDKSAEGLGAEAGKLRKP